MEITSSSSSSSSLWNLGDEDDNHRNNSSKKRKSSLNDAIVYDTILRAGSQVRMAILNDQNNDVSLPQEIKKQQSLQHFRQQQQLPTQAQLLLQRQQRATTLGYMHWKEIDNNGIQPIITCPIVYLTASTAAATTTTKSKGYSARNNNSQFIACPLCATTRTGINDDGSYGT